MNYRKWYDNFWLGWIGAITLEGFFDLLPGDSKDATWPFVLVTVLVLAYSVWVSRRNRVESPAPACDFERRTLDGMNRLTEELNKGVGKQSNSPKKDEIP